MTKDLEKKIQAVQDRIDALKEKRADIDGKIKKAEDELKNLNRLARNEQFDELEALANENGVSMEDIMQMIRGNKGNREPDESDNMGMFG